MIGSSVLCSVDQLMARSIACMQAFLARVQQWEESREGVEAADQEGDAVFDGGFRVPGNVYDRLFDYQKTGAKRLRRCVSGIYPKCLTFKPQHPGRPPEPKICIGLTA